MKVAIVLFLLIGAALAIQPANNGASNNRGNNFQFGTIGTALVVNSGTVNANFRLGQVVTQDYVYTGPAGGVKIKAIVIEDLKRRKGATPTITSGGLEEESVTIRFTSQRGFGIRSRVTIYAE